MQEASPSVVSIQDLELLKSPKNASNEAIPIADENVKVEGTGSGFVWDKFGHIVSTPFLSLITLYMLYEMNESTFRDIIILL